MRDKSNFGFLQDNWHGIYRNTLEAERHAISAPVTSAFYSRLSMELMINWLYENDSDLSPPYQTTLAARMYEQTFREIIPRSMNSELHYIRKQGNLAVHTGRSTKTASMAALQFLHRFLSWITKVYSEERPEIAPFDEELIPRRGVAEENLARLRHLQEENEQRLKELEAERKRRLEIEEELKKIKAEQAAVKATKEKNKEVPVPPEPFSETHTRKLFIDTMLREGGWDPEGPNVPEYPIQGIPKHINKTGKGAADYVMWGDDGRPLAVIEAKRTSQEAYRGQHQAKAYADCLEKMHGQRPIIYFTNGFETWIWDDRFYIPREVQGFHTKDELQLMIDRRRTRRDLRQYKANKDIAGRHYQIEALQRVAEAFAGDRDGRLTGKKRAALLVMATGAGKTRTSASIVDMLVKSNWVKRVLFLADRNALVTQAKNAYKTLLPHLSSIDLTKEKEDDSTRLVFSTYPTIMNRIDRVRSGDERFYGVGHFDLIIVDEAHRSVYLKYKAIFDYFDALMLGLTATPRSEADRDTYELFECEEHNPTAYYELDQAVADKFLVPPKGKPVNLNFIRKGIKYKDLSEKEKTQYEETFRDESGFVPEEINSAAINDWLFNRDTIDKALDHLMTEGIKVEGGEKIGKTIIFARNHKHAKEVVDRFDKQFPQYDGHFCEVIDNYNKFAQQAIDNFSNPEKYPQIAVSVDMLDTGIDIPEIVNLVFFKPVYSSAKYWQMIGRGTRLCPDLFGPGEDKQFFYVFDLCGNFEFFDHRPDGFVQTVTPSLSKRLFEARLELALQIRRHELDEYDDYRHELLDWCHQAVERLYDLRDNFRIRQALGVIDKYRDRNIWSLLTYEQQSELVRHIAPLVQVQDADEQAKRFDLLLLQIQTASVNRDKQEQAGAGRVMKLGAKLKDLGNIPAVKEKMGIIRQTQISSFWKEAELKDFEQVRENLRSLVRLIPKKQRKSYKTNFEDTIAVSEDIDLLPGLSQMDNYRKRVERYIQENKNHIAIQKLRTNQSITSAELEALEQMLFNNNGLGTKEDYTREYGEKPLGEFIRSIVGMDINAAKTAFAEFLNRGNLTADQMTFINNIIDYLSTNGVIQKRVLVTQPFTNIHYLGLFGVFDEDDQARIISIIDRINRNAVG